MPGPSSFTVPARKVDASVGVDFARSDGATGNVLLSAPFDKLWAWGGIAGASKGMDDMVKEASASVAATVAHAKGWSPEGSKKM